ncbi:GGDEF domain-containing protein [Secundilactobacillus muriivasis]
MAKIMIFASFISIFFDIGFIGGLQRLMHLLDLDVEGNNPHPWRTELIYTLYFWAVTVGLFLLATAGHNDMINMMVFNFQFILLLSYVNALKTRLNIFLAVVGDLILLTAITGIVDWVIGLLFVVYMVGLWLERRYFFPFDEHPVVILIGKAIMGILFWGALAMRVSVVAKYFWAFLASYFVISAICYGYMVLVRREHVDNIQDARNVHFDGLTSARNWLSFRQNLDEYFEGSNAELSVIAMDIDYFKAINDNYGHLVGNRTLIEFSKHVQGLLDDVAPSSRLYRTGGEEFNVLLPNTPFDVAQQVAQEIAAGIKELTITADDGRTFHITVSMGVTARKSSDIDAMGIFKRADHYLYHSKKNGRNRITISNDGDTI